MNIFKQLLLAVSSLGLFGCINWLVAKAAWRCELKNKEEKENVDE